MGPLIRELMALSVGADIDVWVADDGSPDGTADAVREAMTAFPGRVEIVERGEKGGRGAAVIADSGVFSTSLSEVADRRYVGTALTAQTAIGFALTVVTIQLVPVLADAVGWRWAFWLLVPGPVVGAIAMRAFGRGAHNPSVPATPGSTVQPPPAINEPR